MWLTNGEYMPWWDIVPIRLSPRHVRLLDGDVDEDVDEDGDEDNKSSLLCIWQQTPVGKVEHSYIALSYTWGDLKVWGPIIVDGSRIPLNRSSFLICADVIFFHSCWEDTMTTKPMSLIGDCYVHGVMKGELVAHGQVSEKLATIVLIQGPFGGCYFLLL